MTGNTRGSRLLTHAMHNKGTAFTRGLWITPVHRGRTYDVLGNAPYEVERRCS